MAKDRKQLSALDRVLMHAMGEGRTVGLEDDPARERWPVLWEWLATIYVGKDYIKTPAVLTIRLGPEGVIATLTDRDLGVSAEITVPHLEDVLDGVNNAVSGPNPPIKTWGKKEPKLRKRQS